MTIKQLRYLDAVAAGDSFGDAADTLNVSQSALSQGLARLEQVVGATLFEPDGRRRRLTDSGHLLADHARTVLASTDRVAERLADRTDGRFGSLRVAMVDAAALHLFPAAIADFGESHPGVRLQLMVRGSGTCLRLLSEFEADLAIVVGPADGFDTKAATTEPLFLYGPPGDAPSPDSPWLLYPLGSQTRAIIDTALAKKGYTPRIAAEGGNPAVLARLAALMGGWTVLPKVVAEETATTVTRHHQIADRPIVIATRRESPPDELRDGFVRQLLR